MVDEKRLKQGSVAFSSFNHLFVLEPLLGNEAKENRREKEGADLGMKEALKKSDVDPLEWEFFYLLRGLESQASRGGSLAW